MRSSLTDMHTYTLNWITFHLLKQLVMIIKDLQFLSHANKTKQKFSTHQYKTVFLIICSKSGVVEQAAINGWMDR